MRHMRVLHSRAVVRNQRAEIAMVVPAMLGDQPRYPQPAAPLAAPAGDLLHAHTAPYGCRRGEGSGRCGARSSAPLGAGLREVVLIRVDPRARSPSSRWRNSLSIGKRNRGTVALAGPNSRVASPLKFRLASAGRITVRPLPRDKSMAKLFYVVIMLPLAACGGQPWTVSRSSDHITLRWYGAAWQRLGRPLPLHLRGAGRIRLRQKGAVRAYSLALVSVLWASPLLSP